MGASSPHVASETRGNKRNAKTSLNWYKLTLHNVADANNPSFALSQKQNCALSFFHAVFISPNIYFGLGIRLSFDRSCVFYCAPA